MPSRRVFTDEFKREAVRLAQERGNLSQTARELSINPETLQKWKKRLQETTEAPSQKAFPGHGSPKDPELAQLQKEYRRLQEENEILKKAVGIFTSRPR